ncbi:MAG: thioredoxin family protein [Planctomycetota bacterium]
MMAATPSTMRDLGSACPDFSLTDTVTGQTLSVSDISEKAFVVAFICNHCPFVKHLFDGLTSFFGEYGDKDDVRIVAISSNDVANYPDDSPEKMKELASRLGWNVAYLYDESQDAAKAFGAACTPDFFVFDGQRKLAYRGQFDDARPSNDEPVTGTDLRAAVDAVLAGTGPVADQKPSIGCNIKWIAGNEPAYA